MEKQPPITPDSRIPLIYGSGRVHWSRAFVDSAPMKAIAPLLAGKMSRAQDLGKLLYFIDSPTSIYYEWSEKDRLEETLAKRVDDRKWSEGIVLKKEYAEVRKLYRSLVLTPGQKLYFGIQNAIERFLQEVADVDAADDPETAIRMTRTAEDLLKSEKRIQMLMSNEGERKVRAGYEPSPYEYPPAER